MIRQDKGCFVIFFTQEDYLANAQQYAQMTELAKRVAEWEDKILPILAEEVFIIYCKRLCKFWHGSTCLEIVLIY